MIVYYDKEARMYCASEGHSSAWGNTKEDAIKELKMDIKCIENNKI